MMFPRVAAAVKFGLLLTFVLLFLYLHSNYVHTTSDPSSAYVNGPSIREKLMPKLTHVEPWDEIGAARNAEDIKMRENGYKLFAFNTLVSSRLSLHRDIPDTRHKACRILTYPTDLPSASVVICFFREDLSTLLRTIHSVIDRSPRSALKEIILVNDRTDIDILPNVTAHLEANQLTNLVKLVTAPERLGLIRARIFGARLAKGDVLVFLDSHVEANVQWLEPLLARIKEDRTHVVTPIIDIVNADTFKYEPSPLVRGGFNWGLNFKWDPIPRSELLTEADFAKPFKSPTMAGGLFAMDRLYFHELGEYDPGMQIWGGENLELSFRVWMCGGTLEIVPCSRVGHVFRKRRPYGSSAGDEDTMIRNSLRVAKVWMDDYIKHYFKVNDHAKDVYFGNITERIELRKKLNCKDFQWYMDNVYPSLKPESASDPNPDRKFERWDQRTRNYEKKFAIRLSSTKLCIQSDGNFGEKKAGLVLSYCLPETKGQSFYLTDKSELVLARLLCVDASKSRPRLMKCHEMGGEQEWKIRDNGERAAVYNMAAGLCLTADTVKAGGHINLGVCSDKSHMWSLISLKDDLIKEL